MNIMIGDPQRSEWNWQSRQVVTRLPVVVGTGHESDTRTSSHGAPSAQQRLARRLFASRGSELL